MNQIDRALDLENFKRMKRIFDIQRLPRLGRIKIGCKDFSPIDYFICPSEVQKIYGERPRELDIFFPFDNIEAVFFQRCEFRDPSGRIRCYGIGEIGIKVGEKIQVPCPCNLLGKGCRKRGHLFFILPKVNVGGVYQVSIGAFSSFVNINSMLRFVKALLGQLAFVPLKLKREPEERRRNGFREIHYPVKVHLEKNMEEVKSLKLSGLSLLEYIAGDQEKSVFSS